MSVPGVAMPPRALALWRTAQGLALVATVALIAALFLAPDPALRLLWDVAIPLLPAVFLLDPGLWRNVCPLGTLNLVGSRAGRRRTLDQRLVPAAGMTGIVLLALMVPARRFLFNTDGAALAIAVIAVALLALGLGFVFDGKAGFCSSICPVLPVERLYGQAPLLDAGNPRCRPCTLCVARGCIDIAKTKTIAQTLGRSRRSHAWLHAPFGVFAAAFPGFVIGYNLTQDGPLAGAGAVYATVAAWSLGAWLATQLVVRVLDLGAALALRLLGATAIALYYWFAAPVVSAHLGLPAAAPHVIRALAFALIAYWLWRAAAPRDQNSRNPGETKFGS